MPYHTIVPDLLTGDLGFDDREHRWRQLADLYIVQRLSHYRPDCICFRSTAERFLETVERFEKRLTDQSRIHQPLKAVVQVGTVIGVSTDRKPCDGEDLLILRESDVLGIIETKAKAKKKAA